MRTLSALILSLSLTSCALMIPHTPTAQERDVDIITFCGIHPDDPHAQRKAELLRSAGVVASMGACLKPSATYTVSNPGQRYMSRELYERAVVINANAGIMTIVYDADIWADEFVTRQNAINFWARHKDWIYAFDLGDEADPQFVDWADMIHRQDIIARYVTPAIQIKGFTNHVGDPRFLDAAIRDMGTDVLSFDDYVRADERADVVVDGVVTSAIISVPRRSLNLAAAYGPKVNTLVCAVNALTHSTFVVTPEQLRDDIERHVAVGCDAILIFGGVAPMLQNLQPDPDFGNESLVTFDGRPTSLLDAVKIAVYGETP